MKQIIIFILALLFNLYYSNAQTGSNELSEKSVLLIRDMNNLSILNNIDCDSVLSLTINTDSVSDISTIVRRLNNLKTIIIDSFQCLDAQDFDFSGILRLHLYSFNKLSETSISLLDKNDSVLKLDFSKMKDLKQLSISYLENPSFHMAEIILPPLIEEVQIDGIFDSVFVDNNLCRRSTVYSINAPLLQFPSFSAPQKVLELILWNYMFTQIKTDVSSFSNLRSLSLIKGAISEFPHTLSNMKNLRRLEISQNMLNEISFEPDEFKKLTSLDLTENRITEFPESLENLKNIRYISLSWNKISSVSKKTEIPKKLCCLNIDHNPLSIEEIYMLISLMDKKDEFNASEPKGYSFENEYREDFAPIGNCGISISDWRELFEKFGFQF